MNPISYSPRSFFSIKIKVSHIRQIPFPILLSKKLKYVLITAPLVGPVISSASAKIIMKLSNIRVYNIKNPLNFGYKYANLIKVDINKRKAAIKLVIFIALSLQHLVRIFVITPSKSVFFSYGFSFLLFPASAFFEGDTSSSSPSFSALLFGSLNCSLPATFAALASYGFSKPSVSPESSAAALRSAFLLSARISFSVFFFLTSSSFFAFSSFLPPF